MKRKFLVFYTAKSSGDASSLTGSEIITTHGCFPSYEDCVNSIKTNWIYDVEISGITPMSEEDIKDWAN